MDPAEVQELIDSVGFSITNNYCEVAVLALLVFDHILTFPAEVEFIWGRKISGATVLFALNRYVTLFNKILLPISSFAWPNQTDQNCRAPVILEEIFVVVAYIVVAVFSALRVYAVWNRDWRPFILVLLVGIVVPATNLYHYARSSPAAFLPPLAGCGESVNLTPEQLLRREIAVIMSRCAIATDALVLVLTWAKTFGIKRVAMNLHIKATLSTLLLRDGTLYFAILLLLNVVDLAVLQSDVIFNPLPIFIDVFTCILISRFILNLREVFYSDEPLHDHSASLVSRFSNVNFASNVIGNLGAPLAYDGWTTDSTNVRAAEDWDTELEEVVPQTSSDPLGAGLETKVGA